MKYLNNAALSGKRSLFTTVAVSAIALSTFATPAAAQTGNAVGCVDANDDGECDPVVSTANAENSTADGTIIVTGSRVRRDNFETPNQVNIITREDAILSGATSTAEVLQNSTVTSGTSQINGSFLGYVSEGGTGANTVGLRGFGASRTLTLLNGRRLAPAGVGPQLVAADLNVLPSAVIQRIEVLREGASSVYGSDAIAGVINVITDTKVDGITVDGFTNQPITHGGGGRTYRGSIVAGKTFDRGYVTASFEFRERTGMKISDRGDVFGCARDLYYDPTTGAEVGSVDPATGELACYPYTTNGRSGTASGYGIYFKFANGEFGRMTYDGNGNSRIVNGIDRVGPNQIQEFDDIIAPVRTYTGYGAAGYELGVLGDAEIYTEALFTRRESSYSYSRQLSINTAILDRGIEVYGGSYAGTPLSAYGYPTSPFFPNILADQGINYFTPFIQPDRLSKSTQEVEFLRWNGGIRGNLGIGDWRYDGNLQYSKTKSVSSQPQVTLDRFNNALMTVLAPAGTPDGNIIVAGPGTAGAGNGYTCASNVDSGGNFIAGSTCVPVDLYNVATFANGNFADTSYNYLYQQDIGRTEFEQITGSFIIDGTLFELPGGSVRAALGYEHREDKILDTPSLDAQNAQLYNFSSSGITAGKDTVDEVFGEINIPLITDQPFARLLEINASGRYTNYKSYGSDFTYHLGAQWAPNDIIRFRANYGTSFRAPNLFEQFVADQTGFYGSGVDPCSGFGNSRSPGDPVYDNCLSELAPILGTPGALGYISTSGPQVITKGNVIDLAAETSKSYGFGGVLTVPAGPVDFSLAVDYWNVKVQGEINTLGTLVLSRCYEADDFPNNRFCDLIADRRPATDSQRGTLSSFEDPYLNVSQRAADGIDFDMRVAFELAGGQMVARASATRNLSQTYQRFAEDAPFDYNGTLGTQGFGAGPKWVGDFNLKYTFPSGNFTLNYGVDYVGKQDSSEFGEGSVAPFLGAVDVNLVVKEYFEHGISAQWKIEDLGQFTLGVSNLFDAKPPIISSCPSSGCQYTRVGNRFLSSNYDMLGRSVFLNVTRTFK